MYKRLKQQFLDFQRRYLNSKTRAALVFTLIVSSLIGAFALSIYFFSEETQEKLFYERLAERANTTALLILEKDELDSLSFQKVKQIFHAGLINEIIQVYDSHDMRVFLKSDAEVNAPSQELLGSIRKRGIIQSASAPISYMDYRIRIIKATL